METVNSNDGTRIAYDRTGTGDPLILVSGASTDRAVHAELANHLSATFTVFNYDRRGRGDSGDVQPYAVDREIEDIQAVITAAGGSAGVFGNSSGAILALRAAMASVPITKLALWEPPFFVDSDAPRRHKDYVTTLSQLLSDGRRGDAMALFLRSIGVPEGAIAGIRRSPGWEQMETVAPTLMYDALVMGDSTVPKDLGTLHVPTLILTGSETGTWADNAAKALLGGVPRAQHRVLEGQSHAVAWDALADALTPFLTSKNS